MSPAHNIEKRTSRGKKPGKTKPEMISVIVTQSKYNFFLNIYIFNLYFIIIFKGLNQGEGCYF